MADLATTGTVDATPTRERIVSAAAELFHQQGVHATSMRQIAAHVGIKAASLYNHFPGKQDLLFSIAYGTMRDMLRLATRALSRESTPEGRLRAFIQTHTLYCIQERYRARVADELRDLEPSNLERVLAIRDEYEGLLQDILKEGRQEAAWDVSDIRLFSYAFATMASAVSTWYRTDGRLTPEEIADTYAEITLRSVRPGRSTP
jgi:AcrR family transcriptional regulator